MHIYIILSSPHMKMGGGFIFQSQWGGGATFSYGQWGDLFIWGSHNEGFPWGTPLPISCRIGKHRTQVCKSKSNKLSQRSLLN